MPSRPWLVGRRPKPSEAVRAEGPRRRHPQWDHLPNHAIVHHDQATGSFEHAHPLGAFAEELVLELSSHGLLAAPESAVHGSPKGSCQGSEMISVGEKLDPFEDSGQH